MAADPQGVHSTDSVTERGAKLRRRAGLSALIAVSAMAMLGAGVALDRLLLMPDAEHRPTIAPDGAKAAEDGGAGRMSLQSPPSPGPHGGGSSASHEDSSREALAERLEVVTAATSKYRDVSVAEAEGFRLVVRELPGMGAHFVRLSNARSATFDPTLPNMLLYKQNAGGWDLMAVGYILSKESFPQPPDYFPGAHWHSHQMLCIFSSGLVGSMPENECRTKGGFWVDDTGWMLHVWLYRENPAGILSELNPTV